MEWPNDGAKVNPKIVIVFTKFKKLSRFKNKRLSFFKDVTAVPTLLTTSASMRTI